MIVRAIWKTEYPAGKAAIETQLYVCNNCTLKRCITSYFNVCFPCHAKGNHKKHMKHMTVDDT